MAKIDSLDLIVSSPEVNEPNAVHCAHTNYPNGALLYNKDGIPPAPLASDELSPARCSFVSPLIEFLIEEVPIRTSVASLDKVS